jgi:hypothetical protein
MFWPLIPTELYHTSLSLLQNTFPWRVYWSQSQQECIWWYEPFKVRVWVHALYYNRRSVGTHLVPTTRFLWGALSDETTALSFTFAAGPRQRSYFRVLVPWVSWPYFTLSDSRLLFSSSPTTRWLTVEVFDHASTRELKTEFLLNNISLYLTEIVVYCENHTKCILVLVC